MNKPRLNDIAPAFNVNGLRRPANRRRSSNPNRLVMSVIAVSTAALAQPAFAEVKSLTSGELTETYIKDSAIIVTPAARPKPSPRVTRTYTIAPGEAPLSEAEEQVDNEMGVANEWMRFQELTQLSEQGTLERNVAIGAIESPALASVEPRPNPFEGLEIPEGAFRLEDILPQIQNGNIPTTLPYGDELNLVSDGQQLTITIGNLPGIDPNVLQQRFQGGLIDLRPRDAGGFDLIMDIPQQ